LIKAVLSAERLGEARTRRARASVHDCFLSLQGIVIVPSHILLG
jgi:hypothetical protein